MAEQEVFSLAIKNGNPDPIQWPQLTSSTDNQLDLEGSLKLQPGVAVTKFSNDALLAGNSAVALPTEQAVKKYVDTQIGQVNTALATKALLAGAATQDFTTRNLAVAGTITANQFIGDGSGLTGLVGTTQWVNGAGGAISYSGGNVGIGTVPGFKLDVAGRTRIRQAGDTAGIWFYQTVPNQDRAFVGMASDNQVGFWGNTGANWGLVMDTTNGSIGIGTQSVDRKLVVRGGETSLQQEDWQTPTFQNGWVNYGNGFNPAGYFKDSLGIIHLRGLVKNGSGTIFTLPEGYRPAFRELHGVSTDLNAVGRIDILTDGQVQMVQGASGWISLDGITFKAGGRRIFISPIFVDRPIGRINL